MISKAHSVFILPSFPVERFCLPPDAKVIYKNATGTKVDAEIFSNLVGAVVLTVFSNTVRYKGRSNQALYTLHY